MGTITTGLSNGFKLELLKGNHDFDNDTFRVALIKESPTGSFGPTTLAYSELGSDQASGTGYTSTYDTLSTGAQAAIATGFPQMDGTTAIMDFDDAVFQSVTTAADGCILYNPNADSAANVIAVFNFGGATQGQTVSATSGDFTVQFPAPGASSSILRLA
mgnify:FL=1|tara:strand:- start:839 stop:1318 length:480 start_codon:yes stop_codon:yes gene_type:complete